jgi:hypothetical protein
MKIRFVRVPQCVLEVPDEYDVPGGGGHIVVPPVLAGRLPPVPVGIPGGVLMTGGGVLRAGGGVLRTGGGDLRVCTEVD